MNLLMVTRKVDMDDDRVGFVYRLIQCLSGHVSNLGVICLERGRTDLPANVQIFSMGKEKGYGRLKEFFNYQRALLTLAPESEVIFGHMNPIYTILAAPWAKLLHRKLVMWYAHGYVSNQLQVAHYLADQVVTSTPRGFGLASQKVKTIGQCIDTDLFYPAPEKRPEPYINLLSVSRLSPTKNIDLILKALDVLIHQFNYKNLRLNIVGAPATTEQNAYLKMLLDLTKELKLEKFVNFVGAVNYQKTVEFYQSSHVFVNMSNTGSLDKAILEAMSGGCLPISCNQAFTEWISEEELNIFTTPEDDYNSLALNLSFLVKLEAARRMALENQVRQLVVDNHNIEDFINRLYRVFENDQTSSAVSR